DFPIVLVDSVAVLAAEFDLSRLSCFVIVIVADPVDSVRRGFAAGFASFAAAVVAVSAFASDAVSVAQFSFPPLPSSLLRLHCLDLAATSIRNARLRRSSPSELFHWSGP